MHMYIYIYVYICNTCTLTLKLNDHILEDLIWPIKMKDQPPTQRGQLGSTGSHWNWHWNGISWNSLCWPFIHSAYIQVEQPYGAVLKSPQNRRHGRFLPRSKEKWWKKNFNLRKVFFNQQPVGGFYHLSEKYAQVKLDSISLSGSGWKYKKMFELPPPTDKNLNPRWF